MITETNENLDEVFKEVSSEALVLDVGGASAPLRRADYMIDIVPYEQIYWNQQKGPGNIRLKKENYIKWDICDRRPWPIKDKYFDYSFCSHVLEDIRDPLWVCSEILRVSRAGYIEIPSKYYERTFGIEVRNLAGASHHRWIIDLIGEKLRFTFKYMQIHSPLVNKKDYGKKGKPILKIKWRDHFEYFENWLNSGKEIFEFYLERPITEKEKWRLYRKLQNRFLISRWAAYWKNVHPSFAKLISKYRP